MNISDSEGPQITDDNVKSNVITPEPMTHVLSPAATLNKHRLSLNAPPLPTLTLMQKINTM